MSISISYFKTNNSKHGNLRIGSLNSLTGKEAAMIRDEIKEFSETNFEKIYIDTKHVEEVDIAGINEIIHAHYLLRATGKKMILAYRENSIVQRWVQTTGLDRFVEVAIIPASV